MHYLLGVSAAARAAKPAPPATAAATPASPAASAVPTFRPVIWKQKFDMRYGSNTLYRTDLDLSEKIIYQQCLW